MSRIAFLVGEDFEDSELRQPLDALREVGHVVELLGVRGHEELAGKKGRERIMTDASVADRDPASYDAIVIPGGYSPDHLRISPEMVHFVREFAQTGRPIAAVCHGPQLLIEARVVKGKQLTSWPSVKTDLENAGAYWSDQEVVVDPPLITSRKPDDLPAFSREILRSLT